MTSLVNGHPQYHYPRPGQFGAEERPISEGIPLRRPNVEERKQQFGQVEIGGQFPQRKQFFGGVTQKTPVQQYGFRQEVGYTQTPIIHKHVYVHVPPSDFEVVPEISRPVVAPRPEKHYKIIFVKVPSPAARAPVALPVQPAREEKTLVYVLVKKPEAAQDIILPTPVPTKPSKPEVFFIRYKARKEMGVFPVNGLPLGPIPTGMVPLGVIPTGDISGQLPVGPLPTGEPSLGGIQTQVPETSTLPGYVMITEGFSTPTPVPGYLPPQ